MSELKVKDGWIAFPEDVTENTEFPEGVKESPLKLDFKNLKAFNSYGMRAFIQFVREHAAKGFEYHNCPVHLVELMAVVRDLLGPARDGRFVVSVALPYRCSPCRKIVDQFLPVAALDLDADGFGREAPVCSKCGEKSELDVDEADYLAFLR